MRVTPQTIIRAAYLGDELTPISNPKEYLVDKLLAAIKDGAEPDYIAQFYSHMGGTEEVIKGLFVQKPVGDLLQVNLAEPRQYLYETFRAHVFGKVQGLLQRMPVPSAMINPVVTELITDAIAAAVASHNALQLPHRTGQRHMTKPVADFKTIRFAVAESVLNKSITLSAPAPSGLEGGGSRSAASRIVRTVLANMEEVRKGLVSLKDLWLDQDDIRAWHREYVLTGKLPVRRSDPIQEVVRCVNFMLEPVTEQYAPESEVTLRETVTRFFDAVKAAPTLQICTVQEFTSFYGRTVVDEPTFRAVRPTFVTRMAPKSYPAPVVAQVSAMVPTPDLKPALGDNYTTVNPVTGVDQTLATLVNSLVNFARHDPRELVGAAKVAVEGRTLLTPLSHEEQLALAVCMSTSVDWDPMDEAFSFTFTTDGFSVPTNDTSTLRGDSNMGVTSSVVDVITLGAKQAPVAGQEFPLRSGPLLQVSKATGPVNFTGQMAGVAWLSASSYKPFEVQLDPSTVMTIARARADGAHRALVAKRKDRYNTLVGRVSKTQVFQPGESPKDTAFIDFSPTDDGGILKCCFGLAAYGHFGLAGYKVGIPEEVRQIASSWVGPFADVLALISHTAVLIDSGATIGDARYGLDTIFSSEEASAASDLLSADYTGLVTGAVDRSAHRALATRTMSFEGVRAKHMPAVQRGNSSELNTQVMGLIDYSAACYSELLASAPIRRATRQIMTAALLDPTLIGDLQSRMNYMAIAHEVCLATIKLLGINGDVKKIMEVVRSNEPAWHSVQRMVLAKEGPTDVAGMAEYQ